MSPQVIHLRSETQQFERRSPLSPETAKVLIEAGYIVRVEDWPGRIYRTDEFRAVGAEIVPAGSWVRAPKEDIILGLKEIETDGSPLPHTYIHFQHVFKRQWDWDTELARFSNAGGILYDLEYITDETGNRVAAFGYWAGYAGTALALLAWAHLILNPEAAQGPVPLFDLATDLTDFVRSNVKEALSTNNGQWPRVMIMGALGRCGKGAAAAAEAIGVPSERMLCWDKQESKNGGPFQEIAESDVFVNCVYLGANKTAPFVTAESLSGPERRLRIIADISCEPNSENHPIPIYNSYSSFGNPTTAPSVKIDGPELRIISIGYLPSMVARESSDAYSRMLLPSLLTLNHRETEEVWVRAEKVFRDRVAELP